jgi:hypothetical protein
MKMTLLAVSILVLAGSVFSFVGCASDFVTDPNRPRPTRAVQDPNEGNSGGSEARAGDSNGVPLVSVGLPNKPGESPKVRTIVDNVNDTVNPPAATGTTGTSSTPATTVTPPNTVRIDPIHGAGD